MRFDFDVGVSMYGGDVAWFPVRCAWEVTNGVQHVSGNMFKIRVR